MSIPDLALIRYLYWLVNTAGVGGIVVALVGGGAVTVFATALLWIRQGGNVEDPIVYSYPTPALHAHEDEKPEEAPVPFQFRRSMRSGS